MILTDAQCRPFVAAALPYYYDPEVASRVNIKLISLSENATYRVEGGDFPLIFRVHRPKYHDRAAIESEQYWMEYLRETAHIATPLTIPNCEGATVTAITVRTGLVEETRNVTVSAVVEGVVAEQAPGSLSYQRLGAITATMHIAAQAFTPPPHFSRFSWNIDNIIGPHARWGNWRHLANLNSMEIPIIEQAESFARQQLCEYGMSPRVCGMIHADLRMSNIIVGTSSTDLTVIDFDDCGWSWFLRDGASIVSFKEERDDTEEIIRQWTDGYTQVRELTDHDIAMIPTFIMMRRIQLMAWIATHTHATHAQHHTAFAENTALLASNYLQRFRTFT